MELIKDKNHSHYWIENEQLFESYKTIRGLRYRFICDVLCYPNYDRCNESTIEAIKYLLTLNEN